MRAYETIIVMDSQLEDEPIEKEIGALEDLIKSHDGEIVETERWGRRKLSFEMKDRTQGFYTFFKYNVDKSVRDEFDRSCKLNESVLRYMTIRVKKPAERVTQTSESTTGDSNATSS